MRVSHEESGIFYDILEEKGNFRLIDSSTNRSYNFKEAYEALWATIELMRNLSFDILAEMQLQEIMKRSHVSLSSIPRSVLQVLKKEKISRTHYDQIFLRLLSQYRSGIQAIAFSNKTNFIIDHEVMFLLRKFSGLSLSVPAARA
ncbi:hypothetical protein KK083_07675 [Fulvivirgaceae bacterium PWU4]|uniref:Uncharacterized protein n=1 Tax=Chryseosolibacter histidini TaxID=2782349 RepID=A0AAP2DJY5_9BACT|nr:hypothetical protein [Chryseosolibacter histidini]MBT1696748.1 hypothetical protein [Chryseosolibacter histidini]